MIKLNEDALMCDLAEVYHIYDYRSLAPDRVATFSVGLRDDSRIKMTISGAKYPLDIILQACIVDRLSLLVWAKTKDGSKGRNKPKSILSTLMQTEHEDVIGFNTADEFEEARRRIIERAISYGDTDC